MNKSHYLRSLKILIFVESKKTMERIVNTIQNEVDNKPKKNLTKNEVDDLIILLQKIIIGQKPVFSIVIAFIINFLIFYSYIYDIGVISFMFLLLLISYVSIGFYLRFFNNINKVLFSDANDNKEVVLSYEDMRAMFLKFKEYATLVYMKLSLVNDPNNVTYFVKLIIILVIGKVISVFFKRWFIFLISNFIIFLPHILYKFRGDAQQKDEKRTN